MPRLTLDIFLSSTSADLKPYRAKVTDMVARMRQVTIRMETFGAKPNKPLAACQEEVAQCDALIVIVGHRYGWIPTKEDGGDGTKSITWWEVRWALDAGKPVYAFLVDPAAAWDGEREQDRLEKAKTDFEIIEVGRAVQHLRNFRAFLEREATRELFNSADDLGGKVAASPHTWLLEQAVTAARAEFSNERAKLPLAPATPKGELNNTGKIGNVYWQEQNHLLSAQRLAGDGLGVRIALISGQVAVGHPVLREAKIKSFDVLGALANGEAQNGADDYTTSLAALLVGRDDTIPYRGIAPGAELTIYRVLTTSHATDGDMLAALNAAASGGAQVICLPLGGTSKSQVAADVIAKISGIGAVVVCPAGNDGDDRLKYPAAYPGCISVAAVGHNDELAQFSNYGGWVTAAAPGVDIVAAVKEDSYTKWSGTSFACATAAGAVALMLAVNPRLRADQVAKIIRSAGRQVRRSDGTVVDGLGLIDIHAAVAAAASERSSTEQRRRRQASPSRVAGRRRPSGASSNRSSP